MNKYLLIFASLLFSISLVGQNLVGNYKHNSDSLKFTTDKVVFSIGGFSALSSRVVGEGNCEWVDDFLIVNTSEYSGQKSVFIPLDGSRKDSTVFKVTNFYNSPIQGAMIEFLSEKDKKINGIISDENGKAIVLKEPKMKRVVVSNLGYDDVDFEFTPGKDFLVKLAENNVIENQTVVFLIEVKSEEVISVTLLSDNFDAGKNRAKSLEKLKKRAQKSNILSRNLTKEYSPVYIYSK